MPFDVDWAGVNGPAEKNTLSISGTVPCRMTWQAALCVDCNVRHFAHGSSAAQAFLALLKGRLPDEESASRLVQAAGGSVSMKLWRKASFASSFARFGYCERQSMWLKRKSR